MKGAILPLQGQEAAGFSNATVFLKLSKRPRVTRGQVEKVGFPEEPDFLILLIRAGP